MTHVTTKTLKQEITGRLPALIGVTLLTAGVFGVLLYGPANLTMDFLRFALIVAICVIIGLDSKSKGLGSLKSMVYFCAIAAGIWLMALIDTVKFPPETLFLIKASEGAVSIEAAPIVIISGLLALFIIVGAITYKIGKKRGDILGIKKEKLFK